MKPKYIVGAVIAFAVLVTAFIVVESRGVEYMNFSRAAQSGSKVQVAGVWVKEKGQEYNANSNLFTFTMKDRDGNVMPVKFEGAKPNNFEIATEVVCTGRVENGEFVATNILTKCPSKYEATSKDLQL